MTTAIRSEATRSVIVVNNIDVLAIGQDGSVTILNNVAAPTGGQIMSADRSFGVGQTRQDVTASRVVGTTYTNNTLRPIFVTIPLRNSALNTLAVLTVGGVVASQYQAYAATSAGFVSAVVLPGETYVLTATAGTITVDKWIEVR